MNSKKILPPTYVYLSIGVMMILHFLFPIAVAIPNPWHFLGAIPFIAGLALNLVADGAFKKHKTTVKPFAESTTLVTAGAFQISRNPMYLGLGLILTGIAIFMGSLTPYIVIIVFIILIDKVFINAEEAMLAKKFGQSWLDYKQTVRRWL